MYIQRNEFPEVDEMIYQQNMENSKDHIGRLKKEGKKICAVLSFIDPFISIAAKIQSEMGLFSLSTDALKVFEDKTCFRETLIQTSSSPFFKIFDGTEPINLGENKPLIIKPASSNGSKDVVLVNNQEELEKMLKTYRPPVLIEEYLAGPQFLVEVVVFKGDIHIVAIIEQEITNGKRFIVTGYQYPDSLTAQQKEALYDEVETILEILQFENGSCHLEMRLVEGKWKLIEINPRMAGGAMNRIIKAATGINLAKEVIRLNLGMKPTLEKQFQRPIFAKFLTIDSRGRLIKVTGKKRASKQKGVLDVYVKPKRGTVLTEPLSLGSRYAYVMATGETAIEAKMNAIHAAKEIRFIMEKL